MKLTEIEELQETIKSESSSGISLREVNLPVQILMTIVRYVETDSNNINLVRTSRGTKYKIILISLQHKL